MLGTSTTFAGTITNSYGGNSSSTTSMPAAYAR